MKNIKLFENFGPNKDDVQYLASDIEKYWLKPDDVQMDLDQFIGAMTRPH